MQSIIHATPAVDPPQRRIRCDQCWVLPGKPCTVTGPPGDHLVRFIAAAKLGLIQRGQLAAIVAELTVIADFVMILEAVSA